MGTSPKKGWFERNQGFITFGGYLITAIIGGISLYKSNSKSTEALKLNKSQFEYEITKDSKNQSLQRKADSEARQKFRYQDSLNKHQDSINGEQLKNFKSQTLTAKEQLSYFKKQTQIAETQLKNAEIIYQQQLHENKAAFLLQDFAIDSIKNKGSITVTCNVFNSGKRDAYIKKASSFAWDLDANLLDYANIPTDGKAFPPTTKSSFYIPINNQIHLNQKTILMIQVFYTDELLKDTLVYRVFYRFDSFNPAKTIQIDETVQTELLRRIQQREEVEMKKYLTY